MRYLVDLIFFIFQRVYRPLWSYRQKYHDVWHKKSRIMGQRVM